MGWLKSLFSAHEENLIRQDILTRLENMSGNPRSDSSAKMKGGMEFDMGDRSVLIGVFYDQSALFRGTYTDADAILICIGSNFNHNRRNSSRTTRCSIGIDTTRYGKHTAAFCCRPFRSGGRPISYHFN